MQTLSKHHDIKSLIPVYLLTGFLGSGKTTLLNQLVSHSESRDTAIIVNEIGEVGLDHLLIETAFDSAVLLQNGCICCSMRGDLVDTLLMLLNRRDHGDIPGFTRVVIETTGLADPAPIMQQLLAQSNLMEHFQFAEVVTTVDVVNGAQQLAAHKESCHQVAIADRIMKTKIDLATPEALLSLEKQIVSLNPQVPQHNIAHGVFDPKLLFDTEVEHSGKRWDIEKLIESTSLDSHAHTHQDAIKTYCLHSSVPIFWWALKAWMESITSLRGNDLLRVKGIVNVVESDRPVIVHGVYHVFHEPELLDKWPDGKRKTQIVLVTRNLILQDLKNALFALNEEASRKFKISA